MFHRALAAAVLALLAGAAAPAADAKLAVKQAKAEPPKVLSDAIRKALSGEAMSVSDEAGKLVCTVWPAKSLDTKATAEQAKAGLKYSQVEETTPVAAVKFESEWKDYRKQKVKPGVYTLRLATQLMDGDHMGTAPYNEFLLLCPAAADKSADPMEVKELYELSAKSAGGKHPAVMLLFPNKAPAEAPAMQAKPKEHVVLSYRVPARATGQKAALGFSLVIVGATSAE
jgi:hypothetical protein